MMNTNPLINKTFLVTGGTGSWGQEIVRQLLDKYNPEKIIIFSRGEIAQVAMERKFSDPRLRFIIGDVRDFSALHNVFHGVDYVFHLAALKHVPICENQPDEAIKTNIQGTLNVVNAAMKNGVKKVILVSTDKAVNPINTYGMTKGIAERIIIQANCRTNKTDFLCIRAGNVLGTNGSLIPKVIEQIKRENKVDVTNPNMTRFFLTLPRAVELLLHGFENGGGGEIYVIKMPSFLIGDVVDSLVMAYGNANTTINVIGAREGEKQHEVLVSELEIPRTTVIDSQHMVIKPELKMNRNHFHIWDSEEFKMPEQLRGEYSSKDCVQPMEVLIQFLTDGGFIQ